MKSTLRTTLMATLLAGASSLALAQHIHMRHGHTGVLVEQGASGIP